MTTREERFEAQMQLIQPTERLNKKKTGQLLVLIFMHHELYLPHMKIDRLTSG